MRTCGPLDIEALIWSRSCHQPGDYIKPLVDGNRKALRVVSRVECIEDLRQAWKYVAEDKHGNRFEVWRADDPRPCTQCDFEEDES